MRARDARRIVLIVTLTAVSVAVGQTQNQAQSNQNQQQAQPAQQQNQQAQPQQKKSFWQKMKESAAQGTQNTVQQGTNTVQGTVQQGTNAAQGTMQQGTSVVQNGAQQIQGTAQQGVQGVQQNAQFPGGNGNGSGAFSGGGGGAGSCGGNCFDAGPFQANVSQMTMSQTGAWHVIRMNIQFHNSTNQPLAIAYHDGSMIMVDNNGASYVPAGGNPGQLQGMGIDRGNQTDSQFVLGPGQTGNALFSVARVRGNDSPVGTGYSYNFTIDELQAQNGAMAIPVRTYNLNFPSLAPSSVSSTAAFPSTSTPTTATRGTSVGTATGTTVGTTTGATSYAGTTTPQGSTKSAVVGGAVPVQQQRLVNGKPSPATPAAAVNNAAMRSTATTAPVAAKPVATAAKAPAPAAAVKPIPATTPVKKTTTTSTPH